MLNKVSSYSTVIALITCLYLNWSGSASGQSTPLQATLEIQHATCYGRPDGIITVRPTGGLPPYFFNWAGNFNTQTRTNLRARTYTVTVSDAEGSRVVVSGTVQEPPRPQVSAGPDLALCVGDTGRMNGSGGVIYRWRPTTGLSNPNIPNPWVLAPTSGSIEYILTVTDANGCSFRDTMTVSAIRPFANAGSNQTICLQSPRGVQLNATGQGIIFNWQPAASLNNARIPNPIASPTSTTTYTVTVSGPGRCVATSTVTVTVQGTPAEAGDDQTICAGRAINLQGSGGIFYSWQPTTNVTGANTATPIVRPSQTTTYTLTVTGSTGCTAIDSVTVRVNPLPVATATANPAVYCQNAAASTLTATGGVTYVWSPATGLSATNAPIIQANPPTSTTYVVTVTDANGCTSTASASVQINFRPIAQAGPDVAYCVGDSVQLRASGGVTYAWVPSAGLSNPNIANPFAKPGTRTTYTVFVTSIEGCTAVDDVVVTPQNPFTATLTAGSPSNICPTDSVLLIARPSGNLTITDASLFWNDTLLTSNTTGRFFVRRRGNYRVRVRVGACVAQTNVVAVTVFTPPTAAIGSDQSICAGASVRLSIAGGRSYRWSPARFLDDSTAQTPLATPIRTTRFVCTVTDANGCTVSASVLVTLNAPRAYAGEDTMFCAGGTAQLRASGGIAYQWSPSNWLSATNIPNPTATPPASMIYTVMVTDASGCTARDEVIVRVFQAPVVRFKDVQPVCPGLPVVVKASGGTSYEWSPASAFEDANADSTVILRADSTRWYYVRVADNEGCFTFDSIKIVVHPKPVVDAGPGAMVCQGKAVPLVATGGIRYRWRPRTGLSDTTIHNPMANPRVTTLYTCEITDVNGCVAFDTVRVTVLQPGVGFAGRYATICRGGVAQMNARGGIGYAWQPTTGVSNPFIPNPTISVNQTTRYTVSITFENGCVVQDTVSVIVIRPPVANAGSDLTTCANTQVQLSGFGAGRYLWRPGQVLSDSTVADPLVRVRNTTTFTLTVISREGCTNTSTVTVFTRPLPLVDAGPDANICPGVSTQLVGVTDSPNFIWSPAEGLSSTIVRRPIATPVRTTVYTLTVTGSNGCTATDEVRIFIEDNTLIAEERISICQGSAGKQPQNVSPNMLFYRWEPAAFTSNPAIANPILNPPTTTVFTLTAEHPSGCEAVRTVEVRVVQPSISLNTADTSVCYGGRVRLAATSPTGVSAAWGPGFGVSSPTAFITDVRPAVNTTYTVTVTDNLGCTNTATVLVRVRQTNFEINSQELTICNGLGTPLFASGGVTYNWVPSGSLSDASVSQPFAKPTTTTEYTVTVTAANGCFTTGRVKVNVLPVPTLDAGPDTSACFGFGAVLRPRGEGFIGYRWEPAEFVDFNTNRNAIAKPIRTIVFTLVATAPNGCTARDSVKVFVIENPKPPILATGSRAFCQGKSVELRTVPIPNSRYRWFRNGQYIGAATDRYLAFESGKYTVEVTTNNCPSVSDTMTVNATPQPPINIEGGRQISICAGQAIRLKVTGGVSYVWQSDPTLSGITSDNPTVTPRQTTDYIVTGVGETGCTANDTIRVNVIVFPPLSLSHNGNQIICGGSTLQVRATNYPFTRYRWTKDGNPIFGADSFMITVRDPGLYSVAIESNGCLSDANPSFRLSLDFNDNATAGEDTGVCPGGRVKLRASGGVHYRWEPASSLDNAEVAEPLASPQRTTTYTVTITNARGCVKTDQLTVTANTLPGVDAGQTAYVCNNNPAQLQATGGVSYQWQPVTGLSNPTIANPLANPSVSTQYTVRVTDATGCSATDTVTVWVRNLTLRFDNPVVSTPLHGAVVLQPTVTQQRLTYRWQPTDGLSNPNVENPLASPNRTTVYTLTAASALCSATATVTVQVGQTFPWAWASNFPANNPRSREAKAIATDSKGNVYAVGTQLVKTVLPPSEEDNFDTLRKTIFDETNIDIFVTKHTKAGFPIWEKSFGSLKNDLATSIAIDANDDLYITGGFQDSLRVDTFRVGARNGYDAFLVKLSHIDGAPFWLKSFEGNADEAIHAVRVLNTREIMIAGVFNDSIYIGNRGHWTRGYRDVFIAKLSEQGTPIWSKPFGGSADDEVTAMTHDRENNLYLTGYFTDAVAFDNIVLGSRGRADMYLTSVTPNGQFRWATSGGGRENDYATGVDVNNRGQVFVVGSFLDKASFDADTFRAAGRYPELFLSSYNTVDGTRRWTKQTIGVNDKQSGGLDVDPQGGIVFTGRFEGLPMFGSKVPPSAGQGDAFVARYDATGQCDWVVNGGGRGQDAGIAIATDSDGNISIHGTFYNQATFGENTLVANTVPSSGQDAFVALLRCPGCVLPTARPDKPATQTQLQLSVYPNPAQSTINLRVSGAIPTGRLTAVLMDLQGRLVLTEALQQMDNDAALEVSGLPTGLYLLQLRDNTTVLTTQKVMISQ